MQHDGELKVWAGLDECCLRLFNSIDSRLSVGYFRIHLTLVNDMGYTIDLTEVPPADRAAFQQHADRRLTTYWQTPDGLLRRATVKTPITYVGRLERDGQGGIVFIVSICHQL